MSREQQTLEADYQRIAKQLRQMPKRLRNKGIRKGTRNAAKYLKDKLETASPVLSGELESDWKVRAARQHGGKRLNPKYEVGHQVGNDAFYLGFLEFGTQRIPPGKHDFMERTYDRHKHALLRIVRVEIVNWVKAQHVPVKIQSEAR